MTLAILESFRNTMIAHARRCFPNECCGILAGTHDTVESVYLCDNVAPDPQHGFVVHTAQQRVAFESIASRGLDLVGFYHSHPASGPDLSMNDRAYAFFHGIPIVVVSLATDPPQIAIYDLEESA